MLRRSALAIVIAIGVIVGLITPVFASGSADFYPTPAATCGIGSECRATIEWRTSSYGPTAAGEVKIRRRTLFSVYVAAGEQVLLGSSSMGALTTAGTNNADIVAWNPGVIADTEAAVLPATSYSCVTQRSSGGANATRGVLDTRDKELAGAQSIDGAANTNGYQPCYFTAPTSGIYRVAFYGTAGNNSDAQVAPNGSINSAGGFPNPAAATAVSAWDISVRNAAPTATTNITGRTFTYVFAAYTGGNPRPVNIKFYLNTLDGFRYRVNTKGFDPNGFVLYGNQNGFADADGSPLNRDVVATGSGTQSLSTLLGGTHLLPPKYPLSFEALAPETLTALGVPLTPTDPQLNSISYTGKQTATGSYVNLGGNFTLTTGAAGTYEVVISRNGVDFDPGLSSNAVIRGVVNVAGSFTLPWDGKDNTGTAIPVGNGYQVRATLRGGEYHAPMLDVESSVNGGPSITLENPPNNTCPFSGAVSTGTNCTQGFFDDRGYVSSSGVAVGTNGGKLCTNFTGAVPNPLFSDPATGFDTASSVRAFGDAAGSNANSYCPTSNGTLGDSKGLDVWTYFPSTTRNATLDVLPNPTSPIATNDTATTPTNSTLTMSDPATQGVLTNDSGTNLTVTSHTAPAHGSLTLNANGTYSYIPALNYSGTDSVNYTITDDAGQTASATLTITVTPKVINDTDATTANMSINRTAAGVLANDAGSSLTVQSHAAATSGSLTINSNGSYSYTPAVGFSGVASASYTARDINGQTVVGTLTITVAPTATNDSASTDAGVAVAIPASSLLSNDTGVGLAVATATTASHGNVLVGAGGNITYAPNPGFSGADSFTYTLTGDGGTATATVNVTVRPVVAPDTAATPAGTPVAGNVFSNDSGSALTVVSNTTPAHGSVVMQASGLFSYTPAPGFAGTDTFNYTAADQQGTTRVGTVTVVVAAAAITPTTTPPVAASTPPTATTIAPAPASTTPVARPTSGPTRAAVANQDLAVTGAPLMDVAIRAGILSLSFGAVLTGTARRRHRYIPRHAR